MRESGYVEVFRLAREHLVFNAYHDVSVEEIIDVIVHAVNSCAYYVKKGTLCKGMTADMTEVVFIKAGDEVKFSKSILRLQLYATCDSVFEFLSHAAGIKTSHNMYRDVEADSEF
jgi:hypothetical protein